MKSNLTKLRDTLHDTCADLNLLSAKELISGEVQETIDDIETRLWEAMKLVDEVEVEQAMVARDLLVFAADEAREALMKWQSFADKALTD